MCPVSHLQQPWQLGSSALKTREDRTFPNCRSLSLLPTHHVDSWLPTSQKVLRWLQLDMKQKNKQRKTMYEPQAADLRRGSRNHVYRLEQHPPKSRPLNLRRRPYLETGSVYM